eukprot:3185479-Amphidinium_carterae.1
MAIGGLACWSSSRRGWNSQTACAVSSTTTSGCRSRQTVAKQTNSSAQTAGFSKERTLACTSGPVRLSTAPSCDLANGPGSRDSSGPGGAAHAKTVPLPGVAARAKTAPLLRPARPSPWPLPACQGLPLAERCGGSAQRLGRLHGEILAGWPPHALSEAGGVCGTPIFVALPQSLEFLHPDRSPPKGHQSPSRRGC